MNREDIIRMAREAGMTPDTFGWTTADDPDCLYPECVYTENLERFAALVAALVAAAEREACAKVCEEQLSVMKHTDYAHNTGVLGCAIAIHARSGEAKVKAYREEVSRWARGERDLP